MQKKDQTISITFLYVIFVFFLLENLLHPSFLRKNEIFKQKKVCHNKAILLNECLAITRSLLLFKVQLFIVFLAFAPPPLSFFYDRFHMEIQYTTRQTRFFFPLPFNESIVFCYILSRTLK